MTDAIQLRKWAILAVATLLALVLGALLATPLDPKTIGLVALVFAIGAFPLIMRWHYPLLVLSWNATINAFFLPGQPPLWAVMIFLSLFFCTWQQTLTGKPQLSFRPSVGIPLLLLALIVVGTALYRGGIGLNAFGSSMIGAKKYVTVIGAILGFFALSSGFIPKSQALIYVSVFFLSGITAALCDAIYAAGPKFYWLFFAFPPELARLQAVGDYSVNQAMFRLEGVAWASVALFCFMLLRYGIKGMFDLRHPWRLLILFGIIGCGLLGGFRSRLLLMGLIFVIQFWFEGLWKTKLLPIVLGGVVVVSAIIIPVTNKLPLAVQRSLSFLPVKVDPTVQMDAEATLQWRLEMWRVLSAEVREYFWFGKGYTFSAADLYLTQQAELRGLAKDYETMMLVAEYHNGWLSVLIPFGVWGLLALLWFLAVGWWILYNAYRYSDSSLKKVNTFLLTLYTGKLIFFFTIYGSLNPELCYFTGILGLSVAINRPIKKRSEPASFTSEPVLQTSHQ